MEELFPGFYERTEEELLMLWQNATFVFDTNMLLNVYRYREATRNRFFEILERLKERIWTPHQAIYEYQNNSLEVIGQQLKVYNEVSKTLKQAQALLEGLEYLKKKHSFIRINEIIEAPMKALGKANSKLSASQQRDRGEYELLKTSDNYRERIMQLFQSRIGAPYKKDQLLDIYRQADKRFELQIPPGWKDKRKKTYDKYGDVILWFQLLNYAHAYNVPIIFVTDDVKSDWFLPVQESNGLPRPRPELVQEMYVEAGVLLHVYQGYEFLNKATEFLQLKREPGVSEDAKEVSERNALEAKQARWRRIPEKSWEARAEFAVGEWLEARFPEAEIQRQTGSDFWIEAPNGEITDVIVKFYLDLITLRMMLDLIWSYFRGARGVPSDKQILFLVFSSLENAELVAKDASKNLVMPASLPSLSVVIGYLTDEVRFAHVSILGSSLLSTDKGEE